MKTRLSLIAAAILVATSATAAERTGFYIGGDLGQSNWDQFSKSLAGDVIYVFETTDSLLYIPPATGVDVFPQKTKIEDTDLTYSLFVGYQFLPWLAAEATWMDLGQTSIKGSGDYEYFYDDPGYVPDPAIDPYGGSYSGKMDLKSSGWGLSVLPMWPIGDAWDLYGRLGYFWGDNKFHVSGSAEDFVPISDPINSYEVKGNGSDNNGGFLWGLGAQWTWDQRVSVRLEYSQIVDLIQLGRDKSSVDRYTLGLVYRFGQ